MPLSCERLFNISSSKLIVNTFFENFLKNFFAFFIDFSALVAIIKLSARGRRMAENVPLAPDQVRTCVGIAVHIFLELYPRISSGFYFKDISLSVQEY